MKILHVFNHSIPLHSGYTFRSRAIIREQQKLGWQTCHVTGEKQGETSALTEEIDNLLFYRTPVRKLLSRIPVLNQLQVIRSLQHRLEQVIEIERPDIIQAHSPALNGVAAVNAGRKFNIPVVYEVRAFWEDAAVDNGSNKEGDLRYRLTRALETYVFKQVHAITCICEGLRNDITGRDIPKEKITVIPNAVDLDQFSIIDHKNLELASKLGVADTFVLGFVGSFFTYEGLDVLLDTVSALKKAGNNIKCLLVGGGPQEHDLKRQAGQLGIADDVIFTGRVPHSQVSDYYSLIDLLVFPRKSMRLTETVTPLKPLESMAQGKICAASNVGGHLELVEHGVTGLLFEKDDVSSLAQVIRDFQADRWNKEKLISQGRSFVEEKRNWKVSVGNYVPVYGSLIK